MVRSIIEDPIVPLADYCCKPAAEIQSPDRKGGVSRTGALHPRRGQRPQTLIIVRPELQPVRKHDRLAHLGLIR